MTTTYTNHDSIDLEIIQGDTATFTFTITDSTGAVVNLTGATITSQARATVEAADTVWNIIITDGSGGAVFSAGTVVLTIPATTTIKLSSGMVYDIKSVLSGVTTTLAKGFVNVIKRVSR